MRVAYFSFLSKTINFFTICSIFCVSNNSTNSAEQNLAPPFFVKLVSTTKYVMSLLSQVEVAYKSEKHRDWLLSDSLELRKHRDWLLSESLELRKHRDWLLRLHLNSKLSLNNQSSLS